MKNTSKNVITYNPHYTTEIASPFVAHFAEYE